MKTTSLVYSITSGEDAARAADVYTGDASDDFDPLGIWSPAADLGDEPNPTVNR